MSVFDQELGERYAIYGGDCVPVMAKMPAESIHLSVYSPPFGGVLISTALGLLGSLGLLTLDGLAGVAKPLGHAEHLVRSSLPEKVLRNNDGLLWYVLVEVDKRRESWAEHADSLNRENESSLVVLRQRSRFVVHAPDNEWKNSFGICGIARHINQLGGARLLRAEVDLALPRVSMKESEPAVARFVGDNFGRLAAILHLVFLGSVKHTRSPCFEICRKFNGCSCSWQLALVPEHNRKRKGQSSFMEGDGIKGGHEGYADRSSLGFDQSLRGYELPCGEFSKRLRGVGLLPCGYGEFMRFRGLFTSSDGENLGISAAAFHLPQLTAHYPPLKRAHDHQTESQEYDTGSQSDHQPFGPTHPIVYGVYCGLHAIFGYGLCWWGGWVIWRRWRLGRLNFWSLLYGLLFYAFAGGVVWHGFIVLQKLLTSVPFSYYNNYMANILNTDKQIAIIGALCEGSAIRSIERMTGVHRDTIMRLGVRVGQGCATLLDAKMRNLDCEHLQLDEIWGFIGKKDRNVRPGDDAQLGSVWTWTAIDSDSKLVPSFAVGKRTRATADAFIGDIAGRMKNRVQLSADALSEYVEAIEAEFGADVDFAQIIKSYVRDEHHPERQYSPSKIVITEKRRIAGNPDMSKASTSYIERLNGTTRLHMRRLTRLTYAFSKKLENFEAAVALNFAYYNFCLRHSTIRCTPAMAAGVENSFWSVGELVEAATA